MLICLRCYDFFPTMKTFIKPHVLFCEKYVIQHIIHQLVERHNYYTQSVQSLSRVQLLWPHEAQHARPLLSITNPRSLPKPMSTESVMPNSHLILCRPLLLLPPIIPKDFIYFSWFSSSCFIFFEIWKIYEDSFIGKIYFRHFHCFS